MRVQSFLVRVTSASILLAAACGDDTTTTSGSGGAGGETSSSSAAGTTGTTQPSSTASTASSSTASSTSTTSTTSTTSSTSSTSSGDGGAGGTGGDPSGGGAGGTGGDASGGGGTGSGSGGGTAICDDVEPSNERVAACATYAASLCGNYERCSIPAFLLVGGDIEACAALIVADCEAQLNVVEDDYLVCLDDLATSYDGDCSIEVYSFPASCHGIGHLADGEPCFSNFECHNGLCLVDGGCGTCAPLVAEGDACEIDDVCPLPLSCIEGECAPAAPDGSPCDSARDCEGQACVQDACATASYVDLGDPCGGIAVCDPAAELACDDSGSCAANPTPEPGLLGEPCAPHEVDFSGFLLGVELCEPGTTCEDGTCVVAGLPGEPCPVDGVCVFSICTDDVCEPNDPNLCACGD